MSKIDFEINQQISRFHSPLKRGELETQTLEVRSDPLTGHQSVLNTGLEGKAQILFPDTDEEYLEDRAKETINTCFLCPENWQEKIPRYPKDFLSEGLMKEGQATLFPNLFPVGAYHAVVRIGDRHFRRLNELPADLLNDGLLVSLKFLKHCFEYDPNLRYCTINANYLFPAGASIIHPHFQVIASPTPSTHHQLLLERSKTYMEKHQSCYWTDLVEKEKELGERWIGQINSSSWITAFSPMGYNEVQAIWPEQQSFLHLEGKDIGYLAEGLEKVLQVYHNMKLSTFNFSFFSAPLGEKAPEFRCFFRILNRQNVIPHHRTDDYFFQKILKNELIIHRPEKLAEWMRTYFE